MQYTCEFILYFCALSIFTEERQNAALISFLEA